MTRNTDVNQFFAGSEPKFDKELSKIELIKTLNWYTQNRQPKDSEKYAQTYFKKLHKKDIPLEVLKDLPMTFGFVCRIKSNGGELPVENLTWLENQIKKIQEAFKRKAKKKTVDIDKRTQVVTIQDRIQEKISEIISEFEGSIDDFIQSNFKIQPQPKAILQDRCKPVHAKKVLEHLKKKHQEFSDVASTSDKILQEGYSNFRKTELNKIIKYLNLAITETNNIIDSQPKTSRKTKKKSPDQVVSKLQYQKEFKDLGLTSIPSTDIIGATQLWVYNTKYKKLGVYFSTDSLGFGVSGSTLSNFNQSKSIQKTLRKPIDVLPEVLIAEKLKLRNILKDISSMDSSLTGRINKDTILLRVLK